MMREIYGIRRNMLFWTDVVADMNLVSADMHLISADMVLVSTDVDSGFLPMQSIG